MPWSWSWCLILRRVHLLQVLHPSRSSAWVFTLEDGLSRVQYWHWTGCLRIPGCTQTLILAVKKVWHPKYGPSDWSLVMYHRFIYTWWFQPPCEKQKRVKAVHLPQGSFVKIKKQIVWNYWSMEEFLHHLLPCYLWSIETLWKMGGYP